jgi:hypothetical protein
MLYPGDLVYTSAGKHGVVTLRQYKGPDQPQYYTVCVSPGEDGVYEESELTLVSRAGSTRAVAPPDPRTPMTKADYIAFHAEACERMQAITKAKNADYTGKTDDPFANFSRVELLGICSTEQGFLTRMTDKLCRLASYCERGELSVKDESVEDTLLDLANYCILFAGYLKGKRHD